MGSRQESPSQLIDRLVLGLPPSEVVDRWMIALAENGWKHFEIGARFGLAKDTVSTRIYRYKKAHRVP